MDNQLEKIDQIIENSKVFSYKPRTFTIELDKKLKMKW